MIYYIGYPHLDQARECVFDICVCGEKAHFDYFYESVFNALYYRAFKSKIVGVSYFGSYHRL